MKLHLVELEKEALLRMNAGHKQQAVERFAQIIKEQPDWEHGEASYHLACCLEDLGEIQKAKQSYLQAIQYGPGNTFLWGGYASFLYLHGDPQEAFDAHVKLLGIEKNSDYSNSQSIDQLMLTLTELASKLVLSQKEMQIRIER